MPDRDREMEKLRDAAAKGDVEAQTALGTFLASGEGGIPGLEEGVKWLLTAARNGSVNAMFNLGIVYEKGLGTPGDPDEAALWFWKAAEQGDSGARVKLGTLLLQGRGFSGGSPAAEAVETAAGKGNPFAQFLLGRLYLDGIGRDPDDSEAEEWFRRAADQGDAGAVLHLGEMAAQGRVSGTSVEEMAVRFFDLGMSCLSEGDLVRGLDCLVSIKRLDPGHHLARRLEEELERANRSRMNPD